MSFSLDDGAEKRPGRKVRGKSRENAAVGMPGIDRTAADEREILRNMTVTTDTVAADIPKKLLYVSIGHIYAGPHYLSAVMALHVYVSLIIPHIELSIMLGLPFNLIRRKINYCFDKTFYCPPKRLLFLNIKFFISITLPKKD